MDGKKLEQIVLLILVCLNGFLLAAVLSDDIRDRQGRRDTEDMLEALLLENGIVIGADAELMQECPPAVEVVRDMELEERRVQGLLGTHSTEDLGGSIWYYRAGDAQLIMRGTGEMELVLTGSAVPAGPTEKAAVKLFARAGVTLVPSGANGEGIQLCCCWNGYPVFNAVLSVSFSQSLLGTASGTMVFNAQTGETGSGLDSASVLVRFVELVKNEGIICSRLERLRPGYFMSVSMSGESTLTPVWHIETDTGDLYMNAMTGKPETLPQT